MDSRLYPMAVAQSTSIGKGDGAARFARLWIKVSLHRELPGEELDACHFDNSNEFFYNHTATYQKYHRMSAQRFATIGQAEYITLNRKG